MSNFQQGWQPPQNQQYAQQHPQHMPPYMQPPFQPLPDVIYDGKPGDTFGLYLMLSALVILSLGLAAPYAICLLHHNEAEHTIIGGRRLRFDGNAGELFMCMMSWGLLIVITLGIYYFWARVEYKKWIAENTHFQ